MFDAFIILFVLAQAYTLVNLSKFFQLLSDNQMLNEKIACSLKL